LKGDLASGVPDGLTAVGDMARVTVLVASGVGVKGIDVGDGSVCSVGVVRGTMAVGVGFGPLNAQLASPKRTRIGRSVRVSGDRELALSKHFSTLSIRLESM
jgi:hypothetical protein